MIIDPKEITIVGETNFRSMRKKFGIKRDDRRRHVYVIGKSGSGKSALLENMIMQDIINGNGCCVMDPHGDLAEAIVRCIPPERQNDVVYFNPSDVEFPVAFNILEGAGSDSSKNLVTSGLIGIFKKIWADSWGPRLEYVLRNTILSLMYAEGSTLLGINRMLVDKKYRNSVLENVHDPIIRAFWTQEYENYPAKELPTIISPIQNKVGQFLSNPIVRNILGQSHSTMDLREIMDKKKIFLVNLSKGRIGEDNSSLIGSMLVTKLYLAAMSRVDTPEHERNDFYLYVDEFQNFATDSFADILSEARKYRLALIIAHQYVLQLPEKVADAIFGNGGTLITFRLGPQDAEIFEKEFGPDFVLEDLVNIPKYNVVLKLLIDGVASKPFSAATLSPVTKNSEYEDRSAAIIAESRKRYARTKEFVEDQIRDWSMGEDEKRAIEKKKKEEEAKKNAIENGLPENSVGNKTYSTNCWVCGMKMDVPFAPDDKRPIYCIDDLKKIREKLIEEPKNNRFKEKKLESSDKNIENREKRVDNRISNTQNQEQKNKNQNSENRGNEIRSEKQKIENRNSQNQNQKQSNSDNKQHNNNVNKNNNNQNIKKDNNSNQQNNTSKNNQNNKQQEIKKEIDKTNVEKVIVENKNNLDILNETHNIKEEVKKEALLEPVKEVLKIEESKPIIKIEEEKPSNNNDMEKKVIEIKSEDHFKSMLSDIMKEAGINIKDIEISKQNSENENVKIEEVLNNEEVKEKLLEEPVKEELIEPLEEVLKIEETPVIPSIEPTKPILSLNQLKEKSFEELNQHLNQDNKNSNQPNVLKAGEVIKL